MSHPISIPFSQRGASGSRLWSQVSIKPWRTKRHLMRKSPEITWGAFTACTVTYEIGPPLTHSYFQLTCYCPAVLNPHYTLKQRRVHSEESQRKNVLTGNGIPSYKQEAVKRHHRYKRKINKCNKCWNAAHKILQACDTRVHEWWKVAWKVKAKSLGFMMFSWVRVSL